MIEEVIVYMERLNLDHVGDFVRCSDCGKLMLMQLGGTVCGECESKNLEWVNNSRPEWSYEDIEGAGYIIIAK